MQNNKSKVVFKDYSPNQILLLPPSLEEMIDPNHPVRVVNQVIDSLDIDTFANRYTFVLGRSISKSKERIKKHLDELWSYAESVAREELENNEPDSFEKIDQESVQRTIESIDKALKGKQVDKKVKQKLNYARKKRSRIK